MMLPHPAGHFSPPLNVIRLAVAFRTSSRFPSVARLVLRQRSGRSCHAPLLRSGMCRSYFLSMLLAPNSLSLALVFLIDRQSLAVAGKKTQPFPFGGVALKWLLFLCSTVQPWRCNSRTRSLISLLAIVSSACRGAGAPCASLEPRLYPPTRGVALRPNG